MKNLFNLTCQGVKPLTAFKTSFILLLLSFILSSCSPQKRLERLLNRYPELLIKDTVTALVNVPIPAKNAKFTINYTYPDSLISLYSSDSIKLTYIVTNDSIIEVFIQVPPDTITVPVNVPVEKIKYITPGNWGLFLKDVPYLCIAVVAIIIAGLFIRRN